MNQSTYIIILFVILFILFRNRQTIVAMQIIRKRKLEDNTEMKELAKRFVDKECVIYSFNSQFEGVIKEVTDGAILIEKAAKSKQSISTLSSESESIQETKKARKNP